MKLAPVRLLLMVLMMSSAACAARYTVSAGTTTIAPGLELAIPTGRDLGYSIEATQLITAHFRNQVQVFQAYITVTPDKITVVALDPFGDRAMTIIATDDGIHAEVAPIVPSVLRPGNILADIAIVYWPTDAIKRALADTPAIVSDDAKERTISIDGREVVHVSYCAPHGNSWTKCARLRNIAFGYELELQSAVTAK
jgi:hypothetical protein